MPVEEKQAETKAAGFGGFVRHLFAEIGRACHHRSKGVGVKDCCRKVRMGMRGWAYVG